MFMVGGERKKRRVCPDGLFTLQDNRRPVGKNKGLWFIEADRSTTTHKRFQDKMNRYAVYFETGLQEKRYGIKTPRVVTITKTEARCVSLCEAAREVLPKNKQTLYFFAPVKYFDFTNPHYMFGNIFMTPFDFDTDKRYFFFPPLVKV